LPTTGRMDIAEHDRNVITRNQVHLADAHKTKTVLADLGGSGTERVGCLTRLFLP